MKSRKAEKRNAKDNGSARATNSVAVHTVSRTSRQICLDLTAVAAFFERQAADIDPLFVCDGVSVDEFNLYGSDEGRLPIAKRFLSLRRRTPCEREMAKLDSRDNSELV